MSWKGYEELREYVEQQSNLAAFNLIREERRAVLLQLASQIRQDLSTGNEADLVFICTHNSRRSHIGHIWAQLASTWYQAGRVNCFSGGTEATAFNPRAVKALVSAGLKIEQLDNSLNPVYDVFFPGLEKGIRAFSKKYSDPPNPEEGFIAVMTCSDADEACPVVFGASSRYSIPYEDPKASDGTSKESVHYVERCRQIAREMLFLFSKV